MENNEFFNDTVNIPSAATNIAEDSDDSFKCGCQRRQTAESFKLDTETAISVQNGGFIFFPASEMESDNNAPASFHVRMQLRAFSLVSFSDRASDILSFLESDSSEVFAAYKFSCEELELDNISDELRKIADKLDALSETESIERRR